MAKMLPGLTSRQKNFSVSRKMINVSLYKRGDLEEIPYLRLYNLTANKCQAVASLSPVLPSGFNF